MEKKIVIVSLVIFLFAAFTFAQKKNANTYKTITPLISKMFEVEKVFGKPFSENDSARTYETQNEKITVWYKAGVRTSENDPCQWNVTSDTVFSVTVIPKVPLMLSEVKFDLNNFKIETNGEIDPGRLYANEKDGISILTGLNNGREAAIWINYFPNEKDKKEKCIPVPAKQENH